MGKVLIIGAGGVATVAAVKVAKNSDVFERISNFCPKTLDFFREISDFLFHSSLKINE